MSNETYKAFLERIAEIKDLSGASACLSWDQETYMPPGAQEARGNQMARIGQIIHEKFTSDEMGQLLEKLQGDDAPEDEDARVAVERTAWNFERQAKVPGELVSEIARAQSASVACWAKARVENDFESFLPHLEKLLKLQRRYADCVKESGQSQYDALLQSYERGETAEHIEQVFSGLRDALVPLLERIQSDGTPVTTDFLHQTYDTQAQWDFGIQVLKDMGFDFERGRQDRSAHPFTSGFHPTDVRLTTRLAAEDFGSGLFSTMHEGGHGLYDQGFLEKDWGTPLGDSISLGVHESQSRMWENFVGRSKAFWKHYYAELQELFINQLGEVPLETFYRGINEVKPSLIRVEADEVTYSLHIILRFEIERKLLDGALDPLQLPEVWREKMQEYLGAAPEDNRDGCMQDIHWAWGMVGYFPTYTLGNLLSAQLWETIQEQIPDIEDKIEAGSLSVLTEWLREKIHHVGMRKLAPELCESVTGRPLSAQPFIDYLNRKFSDVYEL
ncbi:MAG: carboxypeptidase M32 [Candidatus Sumerlaeota bacterium]